ncbi:MAG: response regulator transcription factor [Alphaproteobacteria bacterium]|nr:response regulator transcription factor [Alphaproteobacteria bacterium]MCB9984554.1 response regulator transcription factor [Micavibrio sp.]HRK98429.1 response regulator transcription factor [Alphaproteobacteria bacterium]
MNKKKNTILIVDSDPQTKKMMTIILDDADFKLIDCLTGKQAVRLSVSTEPNLVILDLDLPDMQGIDVINALREWSEIPIIILSARAKDSDIVEALNRGANDYVIKPFSSEVLLARINAALRSSNVKEVGVPQLTNGPLMIDLVRHEVFLNNELLAFTPKEYNLLRYFMINCGKMLSHRTILKAVWGDSHGEDIQYLRVFVGQIREKIEREPSLPVLIITEPGVGYRMEIADIAPLHNQGILKLLA